MRSANCDEPVGWRADVGIGPYETESSNTGGNRRPVLRENRRRVRRGGLYIRPCAPTRRMYLRRTLPAPMPERAGSLVQRELSRAA